MKTVTMITAAIAKQQPLVNEAKALLEIVENTSARRNLRNALGSAYVTGSRPRETAEQFTEWHDAVISRLTSAIESAKVTA